MARIHSPVPRTTSLASLLFAGKKLGEKGCLVSIFILLTFLPSHPTAPVQFSQKIGDPQVMEKLVSSMTACHELCVFLLITFSSIQPLSHVWLFATPWTAAHQVSLSPTISQSLLRFMSIELVMPSNYVILCHPFSFCLQSFPASGSFPMSQLFA